MNAWGKLAAQVPLLRLRLTGGGESTGKLAAMTSKPPLDVAVLKLLLEIEATIEQVWAQIPGPRVRRDPGRLLFQLHWLEANPSASAPHYVTAMELVDDAEAILNPPSSNAEPLPEFVGNQIGNHLPLLVSRRQAAKTIGVPPSVIDAWAKRGIITNHAPGNRAPQYNLTQIVTHAGRLGGETPHCGNCGVAMKRRGKTAAGSQRWACQVRHLNNAS